MAAVNHSFWKIYVWPQGHSDIRCSEFINFYPKFEIPNLDFLKLPLKVKQFQSMWVLSSFQVTLTLDLDMTFFACRKVNKIIASCFASLRLVVFLSLFYFYFLLFFAKKNWIEKKQYFYEEIAFSRSHWWFSDFRRIYKSMVIRTSFIRYCFQDFCLISS